MTTAFSRYAITVWKMEGGGIASCLMVATVAAILSYIPIGAAASKIGRKKTIIAGLYYTFFMTAQIFTPILSGALLQYVSYNTLFPYAIFFTSCAIFTMSRVKHGDFKPMKKEKMIENFDIED